MSELTITVLKIVLPFLLIFQLVPLLIWLERKGSAYIQDRPGPNRAAIQGIRVGGLIHALADVFKLIFKEDIIPHHVNRFYYVLAPFLALFVACITFMVIPFADSITLPGGIFTFQAANINAGILYILAMTSLAVYGIMLAGWSSNNKYSLLGGLRSSAQMISYELSMGLTIIIIVMWTGSLSLNDIVHQQGASPLGWNFLIEPVACLVFIVSAFAETNRAPFDLPESESELVAGYHTEYSSMKFAMFFMAEYVNMVIASALIITLFFGGWQVPFLETQLLRDNADQFLFYGISGFALISILIGSALCLKFKKSRFNDKRDYEVLIFGVPAVLTGLGLILALVFLGKAPLSAVAAQWLVAALQILTFVFKVLCMCWVFIWVRWTLPRIRYDHLMNLGWKILLPVAMANIVVTAVRMMIGSQ